MSKTPLLLSLFATAAILLPADAAVIPGTSGMLSGGAVTVFADVTGSHLNAVGFQVSGSAVRDAGAASEELFLTLPSQASRTGFTTLSIGWNPEGHEPPGIYDLPHFDFHFYYISDALRATIPPGVTTPVAPQFLPSNYSQPGPTVPNMGGHSVDLTSAEWNGGTFTETFIYGYYLGQETFLEPMLTQAYLNGLVGADSFTIRQPSVYGLATLPDLVPARAEYAYDAASDMYTITIGDFIDPVPEPGSLSLLAAALSLTAWFGLRRRNT